MGILAEILKPHVVKHRKELLENSTKRVMKEGSRVEKETRSLALQFIEQAKNLGAQERIKANETSISSDFYAPCDGAKLIFSSSISKDGSYIYVYVHVVGTKRRRGSACSISSKVNSPNISYEYGDWATGGGGTNYKESLDGAKKILNELKTARPLGA